MAGQKGHFEHVVSAIGVVSVCDVILAQGNRNAFIVKIPDLRVKRPVWGSETMPIRALLRSAAIFRK
jgi:hypothetical protein